MSRALIFGKKDIFIKLYHDLDTTMNNSIYEQLADLEQNFLSARLTKRQFVLRCFKAIRQNTFGASY